jgi:hypothetical protein
VDEIERAKNRTKSKIRARVEHAMGVIKRVFGFAKVRYRGAQQEHPPSAGHLRFGQFVHGATPSATRRNGIVGPQPGWQTMQTPQCPIKIAQSLVP